MCHPLTHSPIHPNILSRSIACINTHYTTESAFRVVAKRLGVESYIMPRFRTLFLALVIALWHSATVALPTPQ